jgi:hypothetical protein
MPRSGNASKKGCVNVQFVRLNRSARIRGFAIAVRLNGGRSGINGTKNLLKSEI